MILIFDLCWKEGSLSRSEFVDPIANIVRSAGETFRIVHHSFDESLDYGEFSGIILCGTALKDNGFRENRRLVEKIRTVELPVLGVCAGMQIIALSFGGELEESLDVGMNKIRPVDIDEIIDAEDSFEAYKLHGMRAKPGENFKILAVSDGGAEAMRHNSRPVWGVLFHPEVRNEWVVRNFVRFCSR